MYPGTFARTQPDKPAVVMAGSGESITFAQLDDTSARLATLLRERGLNRGDRIAVLLANDLQYLPTCWAAQRSGLYYVPINWHLLREEIDYILENSGARALITSAEFSDVAASLLASRPELAVALSVDDEIPGFDPFFEAIRSVSPIDPGDESEGAEMIYSSGTTGRPKGGKRPLPSAHPADVDPSRYRMVQLLQLHQDMRFLTPGAPMYHAAPLRYTMRASRLGATNVIMERFDPEAALAAIEQHRVTHSQWVPTMFVRLLRLGADSRDRHDLGSHEVAFHAAAPCPPLVKAQMLEWWGPILHEYYGGSEGGVVTYISPQEWLDRPGSVGRAIVGTIHIVGETGAELPPGEAGLIRAENGAPIEYFDDAEKTKAAHDERGWATVGDMGYLDEDGYLFLTGRVDHMIISGGVNIYPQEVEDALIGHPMVADVAVLGVPNEEYGEEVKAVVELTPGSPRTAEAAEELLAWCRSRIAGYKCPRSVDFVDELPRAPSGKLYKSRIRERYWSETSNDSRR